MENIGLAIRGIYRDILKGADGRLVFDSGWTSNTIVDRCRILLAGFMKNEPTEPTDGVRYLAVGRGLETWDTDGAPAPDPASTTDLENRFNPPLPLADLDLDYLDQNADVVVGPTNRLQITARLEPGYPTPVAPLSTYPLREFGLFGRFSGTDYIINLIRHPVIHKDQSATLIRVVRLYF